MSRLLCDPGLCRGNAFRDFVDIDVHFFIKSCQPEFSPRGFYNDLCLFSRSFFMMSRLLFQWHLGPTSVRGTFATRRATLPVNSAHRHTTVSSRIGIAVLRRRPLTAPGGCRPSFYVMFLTSKCLKSRTVARQTCPMWSDCRTLSNLDLPRASPWPRAPRIGFWRLYQTITIPY